MKEKMISLFIGIVLWMIILYWYNLLFKPKPSFERWNRPNFNQQSWTGEIMRWSNTNLKTNN